MHSDLYLLAIVCYNNFSAVEPLHLFNDNRRLFGLGIDWSLSWRLHNSYMLLLTLLLLLLLTLSNLMLEKSISLKFLYVSLNFHKTLV